MSNLFFRLLCLILLSISKLSGQTDLPQCPEEPFFLSPIDPICADKNSQSTYSFTIVNGGDALGDYEILVPGRLEPLVVKDISNQYQFRDSLVFDCENMPGDPIKPTPGKPYYEYLINVKRTNCVDPNNAFYEISPSLKVYPNVLKSFDYERSICIDPLCIEFVGQVCDSLLIKDYEWFVNGISVEMSNNDTISYCFPGEGSYQVSLQVTSNGSCSAFDYTEQINVTADPSPRLNLEIDSAQLCRDTLILAITGSAKYVDTYQWSSSDDRVSFSDPSVSNPVITILNTEATTYTFELAATNAECGTVFEEFEVTSLSVSSIRILEPIEVCLDTEIAICDYFELLPPEVQNVQWSTLDGAVQFSNTNIHCPKLIFLTDGANQLQLSGEDLCNNPFAFTLPISVRNPPDNEINFDNLGILCEESPGIPLLDFVSRPNEIVACRINSSISEDCWFEPARHIGHNVISFEDSCGTIFEASLLVASQRIFEGGDQVLCIGQAFQLSELQEGEYNGISINSNIFYADSIGVFSVEFQDTSSCGGTSSFQITTVPPPTTGFQVYADECALGINAFPLGTLLHVSSSTIGTVVKYEIPSLGIERIGQGEFEITPTDIGSLRIIQIVETGRDCLDTLSSTFEIEPLYQPQIEFIVDSNSCDSVQLEFAVRNARPDYEYQWLIGESCSVEGDNPNLNMARPIQTSTITTKLLVQTLCGVLDTLSLSFELGGRFQASFDILNDNDRICVGDTMYIANTSSYYDSLAFYLDGQPRPFLDNYLLPNETDKLVSYELLLKGFRAGCPNSIYKDTIEVLPKDTKASYSLQYESLCSPATIQLKNSSTPGSTQVVDWGDGSSRQRIESLAIESHTYHFVEDTTIRITLISSQCSKDTIMKELRILSAPSIDFEALASPSFCVGDTIQFSLLIDSMEDNLSLSWDFGDGSSLVNFIQPEHVYDRPDIYTTMLRVRGVNGCPTSIEKEVHIGEYNGVQPIVEILSQQCIGQDLSMEVQHPGVAQWIDYGNGIASPIPLPQPYLQSGTYVVKISNIDNMGCMVDTSILFEMVDPLEVEIDPILAQSELGDELLLSFSHRPARRLQQFFWQGHGVQNPKAKQTKVLLTHDGYYTLQVQDEFGCPASDSIYIQLEKYYESRVFVPNAFSPNGDGLNDTFFPHAKPNTIQTIKTFKVFERGGNLVYACKGDCPSPNSPGAGWDGYFNGRRMNSAVFTWVLEVEYVDGHVGLLKGDVTLVH